MTTLRRLLRWFLAATHLSNSAVCQLSAGKGPIDYHDYQDSTEGHPLHFGELTCKRCGKKFTI